MHGAGLIDDQAYRKITLRHFGGKSGAPKPTELSGEQIRALRESARLSQAVFASYLNVTVGYVSQLERGVRQPKGPALALLNLIRRKGMSAIM